MLFMSWWRTKILLDWTLSSSLVDGIRPTLRTYWRFLSMLASGRSILTELIASEPIILSPTEQWMVRLSLNS